MPSKNLNQLGMLLLKKELNQNINIQENIKLPIKDIKKVFAWINEAIFDNELQPFNDVHLKDLRNQRCFGQVTQWEWKRKGY